MIEGIHTDIHLHEKIIAEGDFIDGNFDIHWLEKWLKRQEAAKDKAVPESQN